MRDMIRNGELTTKQSLISHYAAVRQRMSIRPVKAPVVEIKAPPPVVPKPKPQPVEVIFERPFLEADKRRYVKIADVVRLAAKHFNKPEHEIFSERRTADIILVRHAVYWLCKECTLMSYPRIGCRLGGRDHTTILHGVRAIQQKIDNDHPITKELFYLRDVLLGNHSSFYWGA